MRRHGGRRGGVKRYRSYTIEDAARATGMAKGTVLRWIKSGKLPALMDQRPFLILGEDLQAFLKARKTPKQKCGLDECYCFRCRSVQKMAGGMAEVTIHTPKTGNLHALCETCGGSMHKCLSLKRLPDLRAILDVTVRQANPSLTE
jgi:excisionase family DNA binding protein